VSTTYEPARPRVPYELTPTNIPGAYLFPAIPEDFEPDAASPAALIKHGLLWRRPAAGARPAHRAVWERAFSRQWRPDDRLIPRLEPQLGRTHNLRHEAGRAADGSYTSGQWAGSVVAGTWTGAMGMWTIPSVSASIDPQGTRGGWDSSSWVGLDGTYGSDDVLQAGIEQRVTASGVAEYVAWYEWWAPPIPGSPPYVYQVNIPNFLVSPGQTVFCAVGYASNHTAGNIYFANFTTGRYFGITLAPPSNATFSGNTAEWIMEAPDGGIPTTSLPTFTPVVFTDAICCGPNDTAGDPADGDIWNIVGYGKTITSVTNGPQTTTIDYALTTVVPRVVEMDMNHATQAVQAAKLEPQFTGAFTPRSWVTSQSPAPDTTVYQGSIVEMHLSDHPRP
jgi:Peptidase A4 family/PASTA domain